MTIANVTTSFFDVFFINNLSSGKIMRGDPETEFIGNHTDMFYWYATCYGDKAFENPNGSGGYFLNQIHEYFVKTIQNNKKMEKLIDIGFFSKNIFFIVNIQLNLIFLL